MKIIRRHWKKAAVLAVPAILLALLMLSLWSGSEIANPPRLPLKDYHREFLTDQAGRGCRVDTFTASDGTPCLMVAPVGNPGKRGGIIREQLAARGLTLRPFGQVSGTLVLVHGRRGRKEDFLPIAERFCAAGFRCLIPDLPAHGDHSAKSATYGINEAVIPEQILNEAAHNYHFDPRPAGLMGISMGGSVAIHAASRSDAPWNALVVIASFDSFPAVIAGQAERHAGITLGPLFAETTGMVYRWKTGIPLHAIQPARHASSIRIPTLIAHGTADEEVPFVCGQRLFAALPETTVKKWVEIPDARHDNVLVTSYPIYADAAEWMMRHVAGN